MTKTLTEQWREGTLAGGDYYIKTKGLGIDKIIINYYEEELKQFDGLCDCSVAEVVAPVPSYEEFQSYEKCADMLIDVNKKWGKTIKENKLLQKQIADANKLILSLKHHEICDFDRIIYGEYIDKWGVK